MGWGEPHGSSQNIGLQTFVCRRIQVHAKGLRGFSNHWAKVGGNAYSLLPPVCLLSNMSD